MSGNHHHDTNQLDKKLKIGLVLNTLFTIVEFVAGLLTGSLALLADSAHNLTDSFALVISLLSNKISKRKATIDKTYGYGRATILGALFNAFILLGLAGYIFFEAYQRILYPPAIEGKVVALVAVMGLVVNTGIALLYVKDKNNLNARSAFLSMASDAVAQLGTLIGGILIMITGQHIIDPIISIIIGCMLLYAGWGVVKDGLHVLLDGVPEGMDVQKIRETILQTAGVRAVDDLHVWSLSASSAALSCHVVINPCSLEKSIVLTQQIKRKLREFHIDHATLETQLSMGPHDDERMDEGL